MKTAAPSSAAEVDRCIEGSNACAFHCQSESDVGCGSHQNLIRTEVGVHAPGQGEGGSVEHVVRRLVRRLDAVRAVVATGLPARGDQPGGCSQLSHVDGQPGAVELRDRVRLHDHRSVADHAVAVTYHQRGMNSISFRSVSGSATFPSRNHIDVIHPHWG